MNSQSSQMLLTADDPSPVQIINPQGPSPFLLIGDHAGNAIPSRMGSLGLSANELSRHIGWDIGVAGLGERLAETIDATFIRQTYSRLVIDCNRDPDQADAMPEVSDGTVIPANRGLGEADRAARVAAIHAPYQAAIGAEIARRDAAGVETVLVSLHSFTPSMRGIDRPWEIGILHGGGDERFSIALLGLLEREPGLTVGDNEPYAMDIIDYTVPRHAFEAGRAYVEIEIRQDLLATAEHQVEWATSLAPLLQQARLASR
jgi:predicted N-formylglutamate amidohydrolase